MPPFDFVVEFDFAVERALFESDLVFEPAVALELRVAWEFFAGLEFRELEVLRELEVRELEAVLRELAALRGLELPRAFGEFRDLDDLADALAVREPAVAALDLLLRELLGAAEGFDFPFDTVFFWFFWPPLDWPLEADLRRRRR